MELEPNPPTRRYEDNFGDLGNAKPHACTEFYLLDPGVRYLWLLQRGFFWFIFLSGILFVAGILFISNAQFRPYLIYGSPILLLMVTLHLIWPILSYSHWGFSVRTTDILIKQGVLFKRMTAVPFARIQHVDSHAGPFERMLGLASVVIHTAGAEIGTMAIPGLPEHHAESLRDYLSRMGHTHANI